MLSVSGWSQSIVAISAYLMMMRRRTSAVFLFPFSSSLGVFHLSNKKHVSHLSAGWEPAKVESQIISPYSPVVLLHKTKQCRRSFYLRAQSVAYYSEVLLRGSIQKETPVPLPPPLPKKNIPLLLPDFLGINHVILPRAYFDDPQQTPFPTYSPKRSPLLYYQSVDALAC